MFRVFAAFAIGAGIGPQNRIYPALRGYNGPHSERISGKPEHLQILTGYYHDLSVFYCKTCSTSLVESLSFVVTVLLIVVRLPSFVVPFAKLYYQNALARPLLEGKSPVPITDGRTTQERKL